MKFGFIFLYSLRGFQTKLWNSSRAYSKDISDIKEEETKRLQNQIQRNQSQCINFRIERTHA